MEPPATVFLVNGFPGVSTNSDLLSVAKSLGFEVRRISAIENFAGGEREFSFAALEDLLVEQIDGVPPERPCILIGFCFGAWLCARALSRVARRGVPSRLIYLAPLLSLDAYNKQHRLAALRVNLFEPASAFLKGDAAAWEAEWVDLARQSPPDVDDRTRVDVAVFSSRDDELDQDSIRLAKATAMICKTITADTHFFDNGRPALRGLLREHLAQAGGLDCEDVLPTADMSS